MLETLVGNSGVGFMYNATKLLQEFLKITFILFFWTCMTKMIVPCGNLYFHNMHINMMAALIKGKLPQKILRKSYHS